MTISKLIHDGDVLVPQEGRQAQTAGRLQHLDRPSFLKVVANSDYFFHKINYYAAQFVTNGLQAGHPLNVERGDVPRLLSADGPLLAEAVRILKLPPVRKNTLFNGDGAACISDSDDDDSDDQGAKLPPGRRGKKKHRSQGGQAKVARIMISDDEDDDDDEDSASASTDDASEQNGDGQDRQDGVTDSDRDESDDDDDDDGAYMMTKS